MFKHLFFSNCWQEIQCGENSQVSLLQGNLPVIIQSARGLKSVLASSYFRLVGNAKRND